jgi:transposase-like protein
MTMTTTTIDDTERQTEGVIEPPTPNPEVLERSSGRRQFSAKYKAKVLAEYDALPRLERGALLRREGLYSSLITGWREQRDKGAEQGLARPAGRQKADPKDREIATLKRKNERLESELDRSKKVIEIQAKLSALLETLASTSTAESSEKK